MNKFVLIDHSLKDLGGHYYTYASCVLPAAERAGFAPVLAIHREFVDFDALPRSWNAHAVFRRKSYSQRTLDASVSARTLGAWWHRVRERWRARERERIAGGFAADCATLFERVQLAPDDHVFIATASELDLQGLADFLRTKPQYRRVHWHLQFHLGIFEGRDPDYAAQVGSRETMRKLFGQPLARIPEHDVHLYCTTEQLTAQYQCLEVASFSTLPYPVHPLFREPTAPIAAGEPARPARIACLGHSRREKGYRQLPEVVRKLWNDYLRPGRAQLLLQTRRRDLRRPLDAVVGELGEHSAIPPVAYAEFPLPLDGYAALVRSTNVGLLLYDSDRYYARCSGVLLEMLSAGVPVVVPAGGWLSEQIAPENQQYLTQVATQGQSIAVELTAAATCEFAVPAGIGTLIVRFRSPAPASAGTYLAIAIEQLDSAGASTAKLEGIEHADARFEPVHLAFRIDDTTRRVRLAWRNAYGTAPIELSALDCFLLAGEHALGAIGLTAADLDLSPELVHEILQHLEHYSRSAARFAPQCSAHHSADQIIEQLRRTSRNVERRPTGSAASR
jgi:glycosyltransferase involved in cell wall biosynthesis